MRENKRANVQYAVTISNNSNISDLSCGKY